MRKIHVYVDNNVFSGYSFYPETDWKRYGFFPPDGHRVLGAWRHPDSLSFAFLLDNPLMQNASVYSQFLVYIIGVDSEIVAVDRKISSIKKTLKKEAHKTAQAIGAASRLDQMSSKRSIAMFTGVLTFVTALVNAYSYYLRTLSPPDLSSPTLQTLYSVLLGTVHFVSLSLLITVALVCGLFLLKYGFILFRRL